MKAFVRDTYGPPSVLHAAEVPKPAPAGGEILIGIKAVSVNPADWHVLRADPSFSRLSVGLFRPKHRILGGDVAGIVEAVGQGVTGFKPGDEVYANLLDTGFGGFAEYVAAPVGVAALKPRNLSFEEAAAIPMAAITALQGFRRHGEVQPDQTVLVNGASGGIGHFAVQMAKAWGAHVTGVTSAGNFAMVRSLGADAVIDYRAVDFTRTGHTFDRILDTIGNRRVSDLRRALAPEGKCAVVGFTRLSIMLGVALRGGKDIAQVSAKATAADLATLAQMAEAGQLRPVIDRTYRFEEIPEAVAYLETLRAKGKVVVTV